MTEELVLAAAGGAAGSLAVALVLLRGRSTRRFALNAAAAWTRASKPVSVAALIGVSAVALACLARARPEVDPRQLLAQQFQSLDRTGTTAMLLAQAPGAQTAAGNGEVDSPAGAAEADDAGDRKEKALASLRDFASRIEDKRTMIASLGSDSATTAQAAALPDVDTMMGRLRARLENNPDDLKGWMTLGWAYANTGQFVEAASAYEAALKLDANNAEIKTALDDVKSKAAATAKAGE